MQQRRVYGVLLAHVQADLPEDQIVLGRYATRAEAAAYLATILRAQPDAAGTVMARDSTGYWSDSAGRGCRAWIAYARGEDW